MGLTLNLYENQLVITSSIDKLGMSDWPRLRLFACKQCQSQGFTAIQFLHRNDITPHIEVAFIDNLPSRSLTYTNQRYILVLV